MKKNTLHKVSNKKYNVYGRWRYGALDSTKTISEVKTNWKPRMISSVWNIPIPNPNSNQVQSSYYDTSILGNLSFQTYLTWYLIRCTFRLHGKQICDILYSTINHNPLRYYEDMKISTVSQHMKVNSKYYINADNNIRGLDKNGYPKNDFWKAGTLIFVLFEFGFRCSQTNNKSKHSHEGAVYMRRKPRHPLAKCNKTLLCPYT